MHLVCEPGIRVIGTTSHTQGWHHRERYSLELKEVEHAFEDYINRQMLHAATREPSAIILCDGIFEVVLEHHAGEAHYLIQYQQVGVCQGKVPSREEVGGNVVTTGSDVSSLQKSMAFFCDDFRDESYNIAMLIIWHEDTCVKLWKKPDGMLGIWVEREQ